jgi:uncharacterized protein (TIGR03083 family)
MADFDDLDQELAVLLALDALSPDEQADSELELGTFPPGLAETSAALAELVVAEPPERLRQATLDRAIGRRTAGRPADAVMPSEPAEAFARTVADMYRLLETLSAAEWNEPAHSEHGRVRDVVAHLIGIERLSRRWLLDQDVLPVTGDPLPVELDHVAVTRPVLDELAGAEPAELARAWHAAAQAVGAAAATGDHARAVAFHDLQVSVPGLLVIRTFEIWAHAMDIASATGRPPPQLDPERMALLSSRLMAIVPFALAYRGSALPGCVGRFVLTGSAGGCYTVPLAPTSDIPPEFGESADVFDLGEPDFTLVADPVDLCRIAARRLRPGELLAIVEGDRQLAELVLADLDAFARD